MDTSCLGAEDMDLITSSEDLKPHLFLRTRQELVLVDLDCSLDKVHLSSGLLDGLRPPQDGVAFRYLQRMEGGTSRAC